jgi:hypothetical protein
MKKFLMAISIICLGVFGITQTALAGDFDITCNTTEEEICMENGDMVDASVSCVYGTAWSGHLRLFTDGWYDIWILDDGTAFCDILFGTLTDALKTEVKCTDGGKGNSKNHSGTNHSYSREVQVKIKVVGECA